MIETWLYVSSHQEKASEIVRQKLLNEGIVYNEIDVVFQERKHPALSCIPCIIVDKDGVEVGRFEERDTEINDDEARLIINDVSDFLLIAEGITPPTKPVVDYKDLYKKATKTEDKVDLIAQMLGIK